MPARGPEIAVKISAKADQFSATVAQIKKDLAALPQIADRATKKLGAQRSGGFSIGRIGRQIETQIGRAYSGFSGLAARSVGAISSATRGIPGFGALAGAASIAGLGEMVSHFASAGVELTNTARLAGTSAEGLNSLRGAARLMGLQAGDADATMLGLNRTLQDATYGRNATAAATFQQLGISFGDMANGARTAGQVLPEIVDKITTLAKSDPRKAVHLMDLVGIPSSALPLLMRGREALDEQRRAVERLYGNFDNYQKASSRFTAAQASMGMSTERLGMSIMTVLEPALSPMLLQLSRFVDAHNQDIATTFQHIGTAIEGVHWDKVGQGIEHVGDVIGRVSSRMDDFGKRIDRVVTSMAAVLDIGHRARQAYDALTLHPMLDEHGAVIQNNPALSPYDNAMVSFDRSRRAAAGGFHGRDRMLGAWEYGGEPLPSNAPGLPPQEQRQRSRRARDILMGLGWPRAQAAGIVAGLIGESGLREGAVGDNGQAYGIAQWHATRRAQIEAGTGHSVVGESFEQQVRDVDWELRHNERRAGDRLRQTTTGYAAGDAASRYYERPLDVEGQASLRARSAAVLDRQWAMDPPAGRDRTPTNDGSSAPKSDDNGQSTVRIEIDHKNVPAGVNLRATTQGGGAEIGGIRVRRAMPDAGGGLGTSAVMGY